MADWQVGDIAECVHVDDVRKGRVTFYTGGLLEVGAQYTVLSAFVDGESDLCLRLLGRPSRNPEHDGWLAARFVKITPPEADAFDREVIDLMTGAPATVEP